MSQSANMKRFTFELGGEGDKGLEEIRIATGTSSKSEVIRDALAIYEVLVEKAQEGGSLFVGTDRSNMTEVVVPALKRAAKLAAAKIRGSIVET